MLSDAWTDTKQQSKSKNKERQCMRVVVLIATAHQSINRVGEVGGDSDPPEKQAKGGIWELSFFFLPRSDAKSKSSVTRTRHFSLVLPSSGDLFFFFPLSTSVLHACPRCSMPTAMQFNAIPPRTLLPMAFSHPSFLFGFSSLHARTNTNNTANAFSLSLIGPGSLVRGAAMVKKG